MNRPNEVTFRGRTYWAPLGGGYVRDVTDAPGTLGPQVCDRLLSMGNTLSWDPSSGPLSLLIRREHRRFLSAKRRHPDWYDEEAKS